MNLESLKRATKNSKTKFYLIPDNIVQQLWTEEDEEALQAGKLPLSIDHNWDFNTKHILVAAFVPSHNVRKFFICQSLIVAYKVWEDLKANGMQLLTECPTELALWKELDAFKQKKPKAVKPTVSLNDL